MANEAGSWIPTTRAQAHPRKESSHEFWPPWSEFRFSNRRLPYTGMLSCRTTFISIAIWPPGSKSLLRFSVGQFAVSRTTRPSFASFWPSTARPSSLHPPPMPCNNHGHALRRECRRPNLVRPERGPGAAEAHGLELPCALSRPRARIRVPQPFNPFNPFNLLLPLRRRSRHFGREAAT